MGKDKRKSMNESQNGDEVEDTSGKSYAEHMKYVSVIAQPMASEELSKKVKIVEVFFLLQWFCVL